MIIDIVFYTPQLRYPGSNGTVGNVVLSRYPIHYSTQCKHDNDITLAPDPTDGIWRDQAVCYIQGVYIASCEMTSDNTSNGYDNRGERMNELDEDVEVNGIICGTFNHHINRLSSVCRITVVKSSTKSNYNIN